MHTGVCTPICMCVYVCCTPVCTCAHTCVLHTCMHTYVYACMHLCSHLCACMCTLYYVCLYVEARGWLWVSFFITFHHIFGVYCLSSDRSLPFGLDYLSSELPGSSFLFLPPAMGAPPCLAFMWVLGVQILVVIPAQQAHYLPSHPSSPYEHCSFKKFLYIIMMMIMGMCMMYLCVCV